MDAAASTSGAPGRTDLDLTHHHLPDLTNQEIPASLTVWMGPAGVPRAQHYGKTWYKADKPLCAPFADH